MEDIYGITPDETMIGYKLAKNTKKNLATQGIIFKIIFK